MVAPLLSKSVAALLLVWFSLGCLPIFVTMFYNFVPSTEWISTTSLPGLAAGLATAAFMTWAMVKAPPDVSTSEMKKKASALATAFFGYFLGKNAAVIAVPMILALIVGHQVELPFTVARADGYGTKHCHSLVELQGLPLLFDRVCGVSIAFKQGLAPRTRIVVIGRGTSLGVYAKSLRRVD